MFLRTVELETQWAVGIFLKTSRAVINLLSKAAGATRRIIFPLGHRALVTVLCAEDDAVSGTLRSDIR